MVVCATFVHEFVPPLRGWGLDYRPFPDLPVRANLSRAPGAAAEGSRIGLGRAESTPGTFVTLLDGAHH